jgi:hypothetical protein
MTSRFVIVTFETVAFHPEDFGVYNWFSNLNYIRRFVKNGENIEVKGSQVCFKGALSDIRANKGMSKWTGFFPCCIFNDMKEGDSLIAYIDTETTYNEQGDVIKENPGEIAYTLTLNQQNLNKRNFEDFLFEKSSSFGGVYDSPDVFPRIQQQAEIVNNHRHLATLLKRKPVELKDFDYINTIKYDLNIFSDLIDIYNTKK